MPSHVALLRGVNVGNNRVAMADLRALVEDLGHTAVATYVNSGNVVFTPGSAKGADALATELERALAARYPFAPAVVVLTRDELAAIVDGNPFPDEQNPKHVHAIVHRVDVTDQRDAVAAAQEAAGAKGSTDAAVIVGRTLYLHTPGGFGRSVLAVELTRKAKGAPAGTARNWSSMTKLLALLDG